ncbi:MAG TPA: TonB-dependent receptor [Terriglobia bacterium]|nr:TonB-dependent receptor [Terriglobia bacterium]
MKVMRVNLLWKLLMAAAPLMIAVWAVNVPVHAQAVYGGIAGNVTDPSGAAIPNAQVTITNVNQGVNFTVTTNQSGFYQISHLIVGTYNVKVEAKGFNTFVQQDVQVSVDAVTTVNVKLALGEVSQTVNVVGGVPLLQTEKTNVGLSYSTHYVQSLPLFNRNASYFELFQPGASQLPWQHAASENPQGTIQIEMNGQEFGGTDFQLDGTDNHDVILGIQVINPNLDSLSEMKMITTDADAEFAQADAGVMIAQTKSGSNQIHGSAFGFRRTDAFQARDPFSQAVPNSVTGKFIPHTIWSQFGGSLGGPIKKDKIFFFGDYQGSRQRNGGSVLVRVPTLAERQGDLSDLGTNIYDPYGTGGAILPPSQRTQFACGSTLNCIPQSMISPQATALLNKYIPLPNVSGAAPGAPNFAASGLLMFNSDNGDVRIDDYMTDNLHFFGRYSAQSYFQQAPGAFGSEAGGVNITSSRFAGISSVLTQSIASGFDYTVSPTTLTDFRFGFFRYAVSVSPNGLGTSPATDAGIPGLNTNTVTSGMPAFFINQAGGFQFGYGLGVNGCNCPLTEQEMQAQFVNNWTIIHGNHTFKFGADWRHAWNLRVPSDSHRAGELSFNTNLTQGPNGGGLGLADFMLGGVDFFQRYVSNTTNAAERQNRFYSYVQDTWHATRKLTVTLGTRWDIIFPQTVTEVGDGAWVNPTTFETMIAGTPGIGLNGNIRNTFTGFGPVAGIAYQVTPKTVLRLGYGRDFDVGLFGSVFGHTVTQNIPVLAQQALSPSQPFLDVFNFSQGPPALDPTTILNTQPKGITGRPLYPAQIASPHVLPLKMRLPTVDSWNVTLQHQLGRNTSVQLGWVGALGHHTFAGGGPNYNINGPTIVGYSTASLPGCPAPCTNARQPYFMATYNYLLQSGLSQTDALSHAWSQGIQWYGNDVSNNYESLQAIVQRRFSGGFGVTGSYTWGRCFDEGGPYVNINQRIAYGPCFWQRADTMSIQNLFQLPFGHGRRFLKNAAGPLDYLVGGWQINGTWALQSGLPFSAGYSSCGSDNDVGVCFPNQVGSAVLSNRTQYEWFKTAGVVNLAPGQTAGPWQRPAMPGILGNACWDCLTGPHFFDADVAVEKDFRITERLTSQFRMDVFNAFNHVNLGMPDGTVDSPTAGRIFSTYNPGVANTTPMRALEFALRLDW